MKTLLLAAVLGFCCANTVTAQGADPLVNITAMPDSVVQNNSAVITISASNVGTGDIVSNSLQVIVTAGANAQITSVSAGSSTVWTLVSSTTGTNNTYKLQNTNGGVASFDGSDILLNISGTVPGTSTISASIAYLPGNDPNNAPYSLQGNGQTGNDTSSTTLFVKPSTPLPIHLIAFSGAAQKCDAVLSWQTASEDKMTQYELQSSSDARQFETVKALKSKTTAKENTYSVVVNQATPKSYYRLKMTGSDGTTTWSNTINVFTTCNEEAVAVFPNPVRNTATITGVRAGEVVYIYNAVGQLINSTPCTGSRAQLNLQHLPAGAYQAIISGSERYTSIALVKTD